MLPAEASPTDEPAKPGLSAKATAAAMMLSNRSNRRWRQSRMMSLVSRCLFPGDWPVGGRRVGVVVQCFSGAPAWLPCLARLARSASTALSLAWPAGMLPAGIISGRHVEYAPHFLRGQRIAGRPGPSQPEDPEGPHPGAP